MSSAQPRTPAPGMNRHMVRVIQAGVVISQFEAMATDLGGDDRAIGCIVLTGTSSQVRRTSNSSCPACQTLQRSLGGFLDHGISCSGVESVQYLPRLRRGDLLQHFNRS